MRTKCRFYRLQNAGPVLHNVVVPKANDPPPILAQGLVPHIVADEPVLSAIGFDDKARLYAGKVDDIGRYWMLPSKAPPELVIPEPAPKQPLRSSRVPAQTASSPNSRMPTSHSPMLI